MLAVGKLGFFGICFLLLIFAFIGRGTSFVNIIISNEAKWLFLFLLSFYLLLSRYLIQKPSNCCSFFVIFYLIWCVLTTVWSIIPLLSLMKSLSYAGIICILIVSGKAWVKKFSWKYSLSWIYVVVLLGMASGIFSSHQTIEQSFSQVTFYQGLTGNSNLFGMLQAMSFPILLWNLYLYWQVKKVRVILSIFIIAASFFLLESYSRSAMLFALAVSSFFFFSLKTRKKYVGLAAVLFSFLLVFIVFSSSLIQFYDLHFYKGHAGDALSSRRSVWADSYEGARRGGMAGLGFGASFGYNVFDLKGLSLERYGREKGNSQLAIIEEIGFIGLFFYFSFLLVFFYRLIWCYCILSGKEKVLTGIILGALVGSVLSSIFEGWWTASGAPETVYFWTLVGVSMELSQMVSHKKLSHAN